MYYNVRRKIREKDIVINIKETYPDYLLKMKSQQKYDENKFYEYIYQKNTRLYCFTVQDLLTLK